ncbi:unnamed protein product, partial [Penicillium discolor]
GLDEEKDPFLRQALQSIADGTDAEDLRVLLEDELSSTAARNRTASRFYMTLGGFAPTVGIIGTVVSLTHVLEKLDKPDTLGPMIAAAFVATLWGLLSANFIWLPIGGRLQRLGELELERMTEKFEALSASLATGFGQEPSDDIDVTSGVVVPPELVDDEGEDFADTGLEAAQREFDELSALRERLRQVLADRGLEADVLRYLVEAAGLPPAHLKSVGFGDTRPVAAGSTPEQLAENRRVDIVILSDASEEVRALIPAAGAAQTSP